jgi:Transglycosylase
VFRRRSRFGLLAYGIRLTGLALFCLFFTLVAIYAVKPPVSTLMLARAIEGKSYERIYVRLDGTAPALIASVIASEDSTFCRNDGVDWDALRGVLDRADSGGPRRGASTITMQTAKNLFLWPGRSAIRKGICGPQFSVHRTAKLRACVRARIVSASRTGSKRNVHSAAPPACIRGREVGRSADCFRKSRRPPLPPTPQQRRRGRALGEKAISGSDRSWSTRGRCRMCWGVLSLVRRARRRPGPPTSRAHHERSPKGL